MTFLMVRASSAAAATTITVGLSTAASGVALPLLAMLTLYGEALPASYLRRPALFANEGGEAANSIALRSAGEPGKTRQAGTETSAEVLVGLPGRMVSNAGPQQWY